MEEMPHAGHHFKPRRGVELLRPSRSPAAPSITSSASPCTTSHGQLGAEMSRTDPKLRPSAGATVISCDGADATRGAGAQRDHATEGKSGQPQRAHPASAVAQMRRSASASSVSPLPSSKVPSLAPTPRKLKRRLGMPSVVRARASVVHHLVRHRAAVQRMRMADHRGMPAASRAGGSSSTASMRPAGPSIISGSGPGKCARHSPSPRKPSDAELMQ